MKKIPFIFFLAFLCVSACFCEPTMAELNPNFEGRIAQALKPNNTSYNYGAQPKPLSLFFFSDVHSDGLEFARYVEFYDTYRKYFDDALCAGDLVMDSKTSDFSYWSKTPGHEKVLIAVGNHDTLRDQGNWGPGTWDNQLTMGETYDYYMKPFIKNWNVTYEEGKTYYYKDYDAKRIRLIVTDCMLRPAIDAAAEEGQLKWFKERLAEAKEKDLSVLVCTHYPVRNSVGVKCNFHEVGRVGDDIKAPELDRYQAAVDEFMKDGGKFVCWIGGHCHRDLVIVNPAYPKQLDIIVGATHRRSCEQYSDVTRIEGTVSQDLADAVIVDTTTETVKLIRVGVNIDSHGVPRNGMTFNYVSGEIIAQY